MSFNPSRRSVLKTVSTGFGWMAFQGLTKAATQIGAGAMHTPTAKHVIFCYMSGGCSHVDSFDPKPLLKKMNGKPMPMKVERTQFNRNGNIFASPFDFKNWGESGTPVSTMFPHVAKHVDDMAVIRSMTSPVNEHAQGNYFMHTGFPFMGHPSAGAWASYGLGSENDNLPGFVVLQSGGAVAPHGGVGLYSSGFLPAQHQASIIKAGNDQPVPNIKPRESDLRQRRRLDFLSAGDKEFVAAIGGDSEVEAAVRNYETAYRMQSAVPELTDISGESDATRKLYGMESDHKQTRQYGEQCLLARRLVERGVRFIELSCINEGIGAGNAPNPWDQHGDLKRGHAAMAHQVDQPIAGLLTDLKQRGLLDQTLVVWAGEFGRTPFSQGSNGRDHNPFGFSVWMAGGGIKGGTILGQTDEFGYHAVEDKQTVFDLWATVLHTLGINHTDLTYRFGGRDLRLTDVHGHVMHKILA